MPVSAPISDDHSALLDRAMRLFRCEGREARWMKWGFVLAASLYFVFLAIAETGPINLYGNDVFLLLDGGWRILNGQVPYRDFYLALGPLEYMITAFGLLLAKGNPQGIAFGNVAFGIVIGAWAWLLTRRRMTTVPALLATAWLILISTCPTPVSSDPGVLSCAMIYNRHGYALLGLVLIECAFANPRSNFWGGASSGIAFVLLAFLKLNFFGIAGLFLLASIPVKRVEVPRLWGFLAGFAAALAAFALYLHFAFFDFFADMRLAIQARSGRLIFGGAFGDEIVSQNTLVVLVMMTVVAILLIVRGKLWQRTTIRTLLLLAVVLASGLLFSRTNAYETGCQLAALWAILLAGMLGTIFTLSREKVALSVLMALSLTYAFPVFFQGLESARTLLRYQSPALKAAGATISGHGMEHLKFYDAEEKDQAVQFENGHHYAAYVNDGLELLNNWSTPDESVLTLTYENPFSYGLRRKPALGGSPWLSVGDNFPKKHMLDPNLVFGNVQLMMLPHYPNTHEKNDLILQDNYHAYLLQHFTFVARSQWWSLYRRNR